jgi:hypothetical protein
MTKPEKNTINEDMRNTCFFCSQPIQGKKTLEHIIPNSLLGKLGIKEQTVSGKGEFQYSRVKVPAHKECNSGFGSDYEERVINMLDNPDKLFEDIKSEEAGILLQYGPDESTTSIISTWLSKIYYGLFYNDFLKINDDEYKETAKNIIDTGNFRLIQEAYKDGVGFCLPSSLYVFKSNKDYFDLRTMVYPQTIMIKINKLVFILLIGDGFLAKNYLNGESLEDFRKNILIEEKNNDKFPLHLYSLAEIMALRVNIPKNPSFFYSNKEIVNMSISSAVKDPDEYYKVDEDAIIETRNEILNDFNIKVK